MSIVPLYGHTELRTRFAAALARGTLPASLLLEGPRGVGKQRLGLWLGQLLLCESPSDEPCERCRSCRYAEALTHPDLHWYFPRPRPRDSDPDLDDVRFDIAEAIAERVERKGLYAPPSGMDGIFVATTRLLIQQAAISPALGRRKVFLVGDAERMVPQEGKDEAANAFLKMLEEPPANTTVILTTSEPGGLLPTVRSRTVSFRVPPLSGPDVEAFLLNPAVAEILDESSDIPGPRSKRVALAAGAPGRLLAAAKLQEAEVIAQRMIRAAHGGPADRYEAAWLTVSTKARGGFADTLDALTAELHAQARDAIRKGAPSTALAAARGMDYVEVAKERILTNVSPQLITVNLLRELRDALR